MNYPLQGQEYIELIKLMKFLGLVDTGGEAKHAVEEGEVMVNEEVEYRKRRKLRTGDRIEFAGTKILIES
ncbi:MAG: RNA-binding S4 domain-containing protein [Bacteroidota bacterium]